MYMFKLEFIRKCFKLIINVVKIIDVIFVLVEIIEVVMNWEFFLNIKVIISVIWKGERLDFCNSIFFIIFIGI